MRIPLVYKPGIQRDATDFQDEYCIDGQWIRFVDGKIRKMKGQKQLHIPSNGINPTFLDVYFNGNSEVLIYASNAQVNRCITNLDSVTNDRQVLAVANDTSRTWQTAKFIGSDGNPFLHYLVLITAITC
jgi:hypothetical protein